MNLLRTRLAAAGLMLSMLAPWAAASTVLTFDDVGAEGTLPAAYGGLDWSAGGWLAFGAEQTPYTAHSGTWRAALDFDATEAASTVRFTAPAVFEGAWFSGYSEATVTFRLYLGGTLVGTSATLAPSATPTFLSSGYAGLVDAVAFASPQQAFYAMDDFTFTAAAVPEPGTAALLLAGLATAAALSRRRGC